MRAINIEVNVLSTYQDRIYLDHSISVPFLGYRGITQVLFGVCSQQRQPMGPPHSHEE